MVTTQQRLQEIMRKRNLRQADILELTKPYQERLGIKMGKSALSQYVNGKSEPDQKKIYLLAQALNVNEGWLLGYEVDDEQDALKHLEVTQPVSIPVVSRVSAGLPVEHEDNIIDYAFMPANLVKAGKHYFYLRVDGDSMDKEFNDGDLLLVEKDSIVENGQIGIVAINGYNATVKRIRRDEDKIILIPESNNPEHLPQVYTEEDEVHILGRVISVQKFY